MPNLISTLLERARALGDKLSPIGPLLARITLAVVFIESGYGKLQNLPVEFFAKLGIPFPAFNAGLAAGTEFFGGILILLGLGTRLVALPMAFTMFVAIITAKRGDLDGWTSLFGFSEFAYLVMFLWLAAAGAGPLSLDALIMRLRGRTVQAELAKPALRPSV